MSLTPEHRQSLDWMTESLTLRPLDRAAIKAALADLDARMEDNRALIDALRRALADFKEAEADRAAALADLDACQKALGPVAAKLVGWQDGPPVRQLLARTVCLSPDEANAVLAAAGEETP